MLKLTAVLLFAHAACAAAHAQDAAAGGEIYKEKCAECHGPRMASTGGAADLRELKGDERARFDKAVKEGKGQMPSWDGMLTPEEIDQIWAYQRTRSKD